MTSQITVRARDCVSRPGRPQLIGDTLAYRGQDWVVVGLFMGADPITSEMEEYLVLEGREIDDRLVEERGEVRGRAG
ncbi:MAG: hypothetical protein ACREJL_06600 [Candidatus Methylomirabilales bacterium]